MVSLPQVTGPLIHRPCVHPGAHTSPAKAPWPACAQKTWQVDDLRPGRAAHREGQAPAGLSTWEDLTGAPSTGTSSIEIPVLCLLANGDPSTLEVGGGGAWLDPLAG